MARLSAFFLVILAQTVSMIAYAAEDERFTSLRAEMVAQIASMKALTFSDLGKSGIDPKVMAAMGKVPRHRLVPFELQRQAYENRPLPIGHGQTISQPYIVALMTDLLRLKGGETVLEVGTGSGYQAAILAELAKNVYTIEIIEPLANEARDRLRTLGYQFATRAGISFCIDDMTIPADKVTGGEVRMNGKRVKISAPRSICTTAH